VSIRAVISLSGGLDSTVLLHHLMKGMGYAPREIMTVTFRYGSRHEAREAEAAERVRQWMSIPYHTNSRVIDLTTVFAATGSDSALLGGNPEPIPEGHYNDATMSKTVVPGRNLIFASVLASIAEAEARKSNDRTPQVSVFLGVHQGDHHIYPDCRPRFVEKLHQTVSASSEGLVSVVTPFLYYTKKDVVRQGLDFGTPFGLTRTCYTNQVVACGKCGSCRERLEAFQLNGVQDFIEYAKGDATSE
jgi:7-cyano-7-deazaguanine synthase